jgi:hypothetical protein
VKSQSETLCACRAQSPLPPEPAFSTDEDSDSEGSGRLDSLLPEVEFRRRLHAPSAMDSQSDDDSQQSGSEPEEAREQEDHVASLSMGEKAAKLSQKGRKTQGREKPLNPTGTDQALPGRRVDKHAPVEERISRRPVSVLRDSLQRKGVKAKDPRYAPHLPADQKDVDLAHRCFRGHPRSQFRCSLFAQWKTSVDACTT